MTYQTAVIVARSIDPEGFDNLDILPNGTGYVAYYTRADHLAATPQVSFVRKDGTFGLALDRGGEVVAQDVADAMLGQGNGFQITRQDYTETREHWPVSYGGWLASIFAQPEHAVDFVKVCAAHNITNRAEWIERATARELWSYISHTVAGGDLSEIPFTA